MYMSLLKNEMVWLVVSVMRHLFHDNWEEEKGNEDDGSDDVDDVDLCLTSGSRLRVGTPKNQSS